MDKKEAEKRIKQLEKTIAIQKRKGAMIDYLGYNRQIDRLKKEGGITGFHR